MYILLIICFLVLIFMLYINQQNEHFSDNTNIYSEKNVFINNNQKIDIDNINVNRLCIKDAKGIECISKSELFNALELPIFRKHSYCINDACMTKNNFKKIKGDIDIKLKSVEDETKCVGFKENMIPASLSLRTQKKWETDKFGLRVNVNDTTNKDHGKISYHSLYEPKEGWVRKPKDYCNKRHNSGGKGLCNQKDIYPNKGYCQKDWGKYDYDSIDKYGCNTRHRSSPGVCWQSAGRRCNSLRQIRKDSIKAFYRPKDRTQVDVDMQNIPIVNLPSLKDGECDSGEDNLINFKIDKGKLKSDITGLIGSEISTKEYRNIGQHENHNWGKYK
jgi:hypothetical protein